MYINFDCLWGTLPWQEGNHFARWISRVRTSDPSTGRQIFPYPPNTSSILRGPVPSAATRAVSSGSGGSFGKGHYGASSLSVCNYAFATSTSATVCSVCGVTSNTNIKTLMLDILLTLFIDACFTFKIRRFVTFGKSV